MIFKLEKPNLDKIKDEEVANTLTGKKAPEIFKFISLVSKSEYLFWDKIKYKEPSPKGVSKEVIWKIVKWFRTTQEISPINDSKGNAFTWSRLNYFEEFFHDLDMNTGGELFVQQGDLNRVSKQKLITRGIMEEAIASSQLEGAATSRKAAKQMLREGRKPSNPSEQMIVNNYHSMKSLEDEYKDKNLSMDLILELHAMITENTTDSDGEKPRLRKPGEPICVTDKGTGVIYHEGPDVGFVKAEFKRLIRFANDELGGGQFIHPVIKAIMIHFWIGYLHPFTDGNGRLARLLFYWYLLKKNYWAFAYLPVSKVIKKSPQQYIMAYVYSEQDDNDLTYFLDYNMKKIMLAVANFKEYIASQSEENMIMNEKSRAKYSLNSRQVYLLQHFYGNFDERTTLSTHANVNQITKMTASKDLKNLVELGLLYRKKQGRNVYYSATEKVNELF